MFTELSIFQGLPIHTSENLFKFPIHIANEWRMIKVNKLFYMRQTSACCVVYSSVNLFEANLSPEFRAPFSRIIRDDEGEKSAGRQASSIRNVLLLFLYFFCTAQHKIIKKENKMINFSSRNTSSSNLFNG